ncbi:unnamed protein product [Protopolystoma xenopodis]|uniref:Uncharacterized protein n=1 Tax=Protopolystoma xenopodis TaxID=117903 RepID=A0A3S5BQ50_9PLAT|nr:unnamed protein product [Protopolystoma xenopodis]
MVETICADTYVDVKCDNQAVVMLRGLLLRQPDSAVSKTGSAGGQISACPAIEADPAGMSSDWLSDCTLGRAQKRLPPAGGVSTVCEATEEVGG